MRKLCCLCVLLFCCLIGTKAYSSQLEYTSLSEPDTIIAPTIVLMENESRLICPEVPGFNTPLEITNLACEQLTFGAAVFNPGEACFTYTSGFTAGTDIICVEACDPVTLACDTLIYTIMVDPTPLPPPVVVDDEVFLDQNDSIVVDVLANDTIAAGINLVDIAILPENGTATLNSNNTISYVPETGFCGTDSLLYLVVDQSYNGEFATVYFDIACTEAPFTVYTGFSPNDDNINDVFFIENLERVPDHKLSIFNRWGNLVYAAKDYQNDWGGTWNGEDLPDGTYFYILDDGNGNSFHGYVQLQR